ncbi:MAG: TMEM43 family protein [Rhodanobacteraceae bacterium]
MKSVAARLRSRRGTIAAAVILMLIVVGVIGVFTWHRSPLPAPGSRSTSSAVDHEGTVAALAVAADHVDPANEGRLVAISGPLVANTPATDSQLGVSADALTLLRHVEMLQWRERCVDGSCTYAKVWSGQWIDSASFHEAAGHENPVRLPFRESRFNAGGLHIGAFALSAAPRLDGPRPRAYPVHVAQLPPNLAVSFHDQDGVLVAGGDPAHPKVGDLRVSYRIIPLGALKVSGVQIGDKLLLRSAVAL